MSQVGLVRIQYKWIVEQTGNRFFCLYRLVKTVACGNSGSGQLPYVPDVY
jgi:hypothetical protein